ncbi:ABC transporter substrate-binding protein [Actinophytocola sp.]|uniref:ABC transporter substrate-binding protein n=1 Tax=Actinophytocola sp. TaxID=1872138 RepID=UPI003D6C0791
MKRKRLITATAVSAVVALVVSACGGGDGDGDGNGGNAEPAFNAAVGKIYNPSDETGGIIKMANNGDWDSLDPGETYYGYSWDFLRLYGRALVMYKIAPGEESGELVPDLAESLGESSPDAKTWTYKIRKGVKYEDGTEVTAHDVKHAVLRSTDKETFPNGPAYWEGFLNLPEGYQGPYKTPDMNTDQAIEVPDDQTIIFKLKTPFSGMDYLAQLPQTVPVPEDKDKGAQYREHVISTGPYMFDTNELGKRFTLKRNPEWSKETDPNRNPLPDGFDVALNVNQDDIDNQLMSGDLHVHVTGTGLGSAAQGRVLSDESLKAEADNPYLVRLWYTSVNPQVAPLDNIDCRKAIMYATDRTGYQRAMGGDVAGGDIATHLLPPQIPGSQDFDLYPAGEDNKGDLDKAKQHLKDCGQPDGFATNITYRNERPQEKAVAEALQQSLKRVGIELTLKGFPQGDYFSQYAGRPPYAKQNNLGLVVNGWGADWNDGFGFLSQIVDSRVIRETGGSSNISVRIPEVDQALDAALVELDEGKREQIYADIDKRVMEEAVILPGVIAKVLLYRGKGLTNVFINEQYGYYDYMAMGVEQ